IGEKIGCGAYLFKLSRIKVGDFTLQEALTPNEIKYYCQAGTLKRYLKSIEMIVAFPSIQVSEEFAPLILVGRQPRMKDITAISGDFARNDHISLIDQTGKIMAIGKAGLDSSDFRNSNGQAVLTYVRVLN
ncbi:MAG: hypothetical protein NTV06_05285, partial [candidate division Zixibacteria bacterium]|nr:hypothetical protein [candidate division Zixibacteria bacterium]